MSSANLRAKVSMSHMDAGSSVPSTYNQPAITNNTNTNTITQQDRATTQARLSSMRSFAALRRPSPAYHTNVTTAQRHQPSFGFPPAPALPNMLADLRLNTSSPLEGSSGHSAGLAPGLGRNVNAPSPTGSVSTSEQGIIKQDVQDAASPPGAAMPVPTSRVLP